MIALENYEFDVIAGTKVSLMRAVNNDMDLQRCRMTLDEEIEKFDEISHVGIDFNGDVFMYSKPVTFCGTQLKWGKDHEINVPDIGIMYIGNASRSGHGAGNAGLHLANIRTAFAPIETQVVHDILKQYYNECEVYVDSVRLPI